MMKMSSWISAIRVMKMKHGLHVSLLLLLNTMRLWPLPVALILLPFVTPSQISWSSSATTLVTALSNDPDYTSLLRLLQRARLIPTLNKLNGSTFFAPTNDAIKRHFSRNPLWATLLQEDHHLVLNDNVQEQLRQQLFYHLFNYSLVSLPTDQNIQYHRTLLFPHTPLQPPSRKPPPSPPWMPTPGGTLGGEPQRLRVAAREEGAWVGVDAFGKGGSQIIKGQTDAGNGILLGIADVLDPPPDLGQ
jgi:solute carrier family 25 (mitochondrial carnitine/acylcarnitine transporter), member 20/29